MSRLEEARTLLSCFSEDGRRPRFAPTAAAKLAEHLEAMERRWCGALASEVHARVFGLISKVASGEVSAEFARGFAEGLTALEHELLTRAARQGEEVSR